MLMVMPAYREAEIPKLQQNQSEHLAEVIDLDTVRNRGRFLIETIQKSHSLARSAEGDEYGLVCEPILEGLADALASGKTSLKNQNELYEQLYDDDQLWVEPFIERANPKQEVIFAEDYHLVTWRKNSRYTFGWCANNFCTGRHNFEEWIEVPVTLNSPIELQNGSHIVLDPDTDINPSEVQTASYEFSRVIKTLNNHFKNSQ